jgi:ACS family 4-hydroxyphenylacetate permease-like MFS transporter
LERSNYWNVPKQSQQRKWHTVLPMLFAAAGWLITAYGDGSTEPKLVVRESSGPTLAPAVVG